MPEQVPEHRQTHVDGRATGRQASFTSGSGRPKNDAVANSGGTKMASQTSFPSLGRLTEVQEEEIVLVHSFLNSQPQIDALPPGQANYEDHVSKELHWIDRPRMDKLAAAGRLGRDERHPHSIPVSPRTGRAVPERPANNSYNALSRDTRSSASRIAAPPAGILKPGHKSKRSSSRDGAGTVSRMQALELEACGLETTASGDNVVADASTGCTGGEAIASSRRTGGAKMEDEVVVEDLSEPQSDRWSSDVGDSGIEVGKSPPHLTVSSGGGKPQIDRQARGPRLSPNGTTTDATSSVEKEDAASANTVVSRRDERDLESSSTISPRDCPLHKTPSSAVQASSFGHSSSSNQHIVHTVRRSGEARQEERQAWDGRNTDAEVGEGKKARVQGRTSQMDGCRGETERTQQRVDKTRGGDNTTSAACHARATAPSPDQHPPKVVSVFKEVPAQEKESHTRWDGQRSTEGSTKGSRQRDNVANRINKSGGERGSLNMVAANVDESAAVEAPTAVSAAKQIRRTGSEGAISFSPAELGTSLGLQPDKSYLPQAPLGRSKTAQMDPPGPGWGPADMNSDSTAATEGPRQPHQGRVRRTVEDSYGEGDGTWAREVPVEQGLYPGGESGGSLQQLAQTPNPQQRKLPSPRPHQERNQVMCTRINDLCSARMSVDRTFRRCSALHAWYSDTPDV